MNERERKELALEQLYREALTTFAARVGVKLTRVQAKLLERWLHRHNIHLVTHCRALDHEEQHAGSLN